MGREVRRRVDVDSVFEFVGQLVGDHLRGLVRPVIVVEGVNQRVDAQGDGKVSVIRGSLLLCAVLSGPLSVVLVLRDGVCLAE